ncbi:NAD(P)/FAD-dependent oxidoreductase [Brevundimonas sp. S30B]|uniref:NAD(P)/FAD-dependent oxidoreductase n=1 Tax=unclassified Brevundimonas TaxID=2622653 RepID=UPI0010729CC5|nr:MULTISPECIES: NAD(P)/FAD-dependent oxidoreductase [unclassified Brevundimonas]QBX37920.1 NAD(P)/FAD-dependent oxidoreductase [Brevundimonas sp. MF30-B]TFW02725.1 NAD(P)/FAD-dependent oxidoreductase [Brevundimonas sp. S30B]
MTFDFDATVVGAGAVGLACGRALSKRGLTVLVLEREPHIGQGVSSRNSEVIHGGLYYPSGSLKARFCVEGRRRLYAFLESRKIEHWKCGKLVVATEEAEVERIEAIFQQATTNDVEGLEHLTGAQARALEPALNAHAAILSPESGVFDSHGYMLALQGEIEDAGGSVVVSAPFEGAESLAAGGFSIRVGGEGAMTVTSPLLVTAPGLQAQAVAARIEDYPAGDIPQGHFGKGVYFRLTGAAPFNRLIYPPPIPGALGTHYRKDLGGQGVFGPDLAYVETEDYSVDPAKAEEFARYIRRFWPGVEVERLTPDYAGIRPKLHGPGEVQPDFQLHGREHHGIDGLMALFGIESPGLTSSLAIGEAVAERLGE